MGALDVLRRAWATTDSMLCVGIDPDPARLPSPLDRSPDALWRFCKAIVDATADLVCAFKPQFAYFAAQRAEPELERLCHYIRERHPGVLLVLDAKRGDIGPTAEQYAKEAFGRYAAHMVTVNPYLGTDSVTPYLAHEGHGVLVLCRTSNPGGADFQHLDVGGEPLYQRVARKVAGEWAALGDCGLVVGATYPAELAAVRAIASELPILVPGVGAQGGDVAATVRAGLDASGAGLIISTSRAVMYASAGEDFAAAARAEAERTRDAIRVSCRAAA